MEVALKKQSEIQQIIANAIASERDTVLQLASDYQFDGNAALFISLDIIFLCWSKCYQVTTIYLNIVLHLKFCCMKT